MDTWKPKYFNKQDLPDRTTTKKLPFSCAFLNKKEFAITIFVCMFQQKHLKCLGDFFKITVLEVGLVTCFRERCYFTEIALVLSTVAS